jgi:hypothetical protein
MSYKRTLQERQDHVSELAKEGVKAQMPTEDQVITVVGMVLYPEDFDTVLYTDLMSTEKMAKRGIVQRLPAPWTNQAPADDRWLKAEEYYTVSFRQVFRRIMSYNPNQLRSAINYRLKHSTTRLSATADYLKVGDDGVYFNYNIADCRDGFGGSVGAKAWFTSQMVCGRSEATMNNARWVWCNASFDPSTGYESAWTILPQSAVANDCIIQLIRWNGGEPVEVRILVTPTHTIRTCTKEESGVR